MHGSKCASTRTCHQRNGSTSCYNLSAMAQPGLKTGTQWITKEVQPEHNGSTSWHNLNATAHLKALGPLPVVPPFRDHDSIRGISAMAAQHSLVQSPLQHLRSQAKYNHGFNWNLKGQVPAGCSHVHSLSLEFVPIFSRQEEQVKCQAVNCLRVGGDISVTNSSGLSRNFVRLAIYQRRKEEKRETRWIE